MGFTAKEKWEAAERELRLRKRVYPNRLLTGRMSEKQVQRELALMEEIANDYRTIAEREEPTLI